MTAKPLTPTYCTKCHTKYWYKPGWFVDRSCPNHSDLLKWILIAMTLAAALAIVVMW